MGNEQSPPADQAAERHDRGGEKGRSRNDACAKACKRNPEALRFVGRERRHVEAPGEKFKCDERQKNEGRARENAVDGRARKGAHEPEGDLRKNVLGVGHVLDERNEGREERRHDHARENHHEKSRLASHARDREHEKDGEKAARQGAELNPEARRAEENAEHTAQHVHE